MEIAKKIENTLKYITTKKTGTLLIRVFAWEGCSQLDYFNAAIGKLLISKELGSELTVKIEYKGAKDIRTSLELEALPPSDNDEEDNEEVDEEDNKDDSDERLVKFRHIVADFADHMGSQEGGAKSVDDVRQGITIVLISP